MLETCILHQGADNSSFAAGKNRTTATISEEIIQFDPISATTTASDEIKDFGWLHRTPKWSQIRGF